MYRKLVLGFYLACSLKGWAGDIKYPVGAIPEKLRQDADVVKRMEETEVEILSPKEVRVHYKYALTILNEKGEDYAGFSEYYDKLRHITSIEGALYDEKGNL